MQHVKKRVENEAKLFLTSKNPSPSYPVYPDK